MPPVLRSHKAREAREAAEAAEAQKLVHDSVSTVATPHRVGFIDGQTAANRALHIAEILVFIFQYLAEVPDDESSSPSSSSSSSESASDEESAANDESSSSSSSESVSDGSSSNGSKVSVKELMNCALVDRFWNHYASPFVWKHLPASSLSDLSVFTMPLMDKSPHAQLLIDSIESASLYLFVDSLHDYRVLARSMNHLAFERLSSLHLEIVMMPEMGAGRSFPNKPGKIAKDCALMQLPALRQLSLGYVRNWTSKESGRYVVLPEHWKDLLMTLVDRAAPLKKLTLSSAFIIDDICLQYFKARTEKLTVPEWEYRPEEVFRVLKSWRARLGILGREGLV